MYLPIGRPSFSFFLVLLFLFSIQESKEALFDQPISDIVYSLVGDSVLCVLFPRPISCEGLF